MKLLRQFQFSVLFQLIVKRFVKLVGNNCPSLFCEMFLFSYIFFLVPLCLPGWVSDWVTHMHVYGREHSASVAACDWAGTSAIGISGVLNFVTDSLLILSHGYARRSSPSAEDLVFNAKKCGVQNLVCSYDIWSVFRIYHRQGWCKKMYLQQTSRLEKSLWEQIWWSFGEILGKLKTLAQPEGRPWWSVDP